MLTLTSSPNLDNDFLQFLPFLSEVSPNLEYYISCINQCNSSNVMFGERPLMISIFSALSCGCYNNQLEQFEKLVRLLLDKNFDPNVKENYQTKINGNIFSNCSCIHILYLYWKLNEWEDDKKEILKQLFDHMLTDPRVNIGDTFSEEYTDRNPDWDFLSGGFALEVDFHTSLRNLLEEANLLHYASSIGDALTIEKLLQRDPCLIYTHCSTVVGKNLLTYEKNYNFRLDQEERTNDVLVKKNNHGVIAVICSRIGEKRPVFFVKRIEKVTALHIAARETHTLVCGLLTGRYAFRGSLDSKNQMPKDYLESAFQGWKISGGFNYKNCKFDFKNNSEIKELQNFLKYNPQIPRFLPQVTYFVQKEYFSVLYDGRTKVAVYTYEILTKGDLEKNVIRGGQGFTQEDTIIPLHHAKNSDFPGSKKDKGHFRAAENAVKSFSAMKETFKFVNIFPQDPDLNKSYWKRLENEVRRLAISNLCLEIFTGTLYVPMLYPDGKKRICFEVIGAGDVAVPTYVYKVLFVHNQVGFEPIVYLFPNQKIEPKKLSLDLFKVSIQFIENLSKIPFTSLRGC